MCVHSNASLLPINPDNPVHPSNGAIFPVVRHESATARIHPSKRRDPKRCTLGVDDGSHPVERIALSAELDRHDTIIAGRNNPPSQP